MLSKVKITTEGSNFYDKRGQLSLLKLLSEVKPTLAARVEDKFICIIPCKKEENEVKSRPKGVIFAISEGN